MTSDFSLQKIRKHFKDDMLSAFSVALVAMPLGLGIAIASGVPPMAGLWAAIMGGLVTTLFRGGHISINGPAAGLIVVILGGMESLHDETFASGFQYVLAATVITGGIQVLLGGLRLGKFADMVPSSVIQGMLAAIGVIIFTKQLPHAFGVESLEKPILQELTSIPYYFLQQNPVVSLITAVSLVVLLVHPKLKSKLVSVIPPPIWVLVLTIPLVFVFNFFEERTYNLLGYVYSISPDYLVSVPNDIAQSIMLPNFSKMDTLAFWLLVLTLSVIASIQTLVVAKAVDQLDPKKRRTNLNRDLIGVGMGTALSGMLGGLPLIAVIVRSSVNIQNGGKTRWSNFYHGLILLVLVAFGASFLGIIPLAALAGLLVFTGFKLASPKMFRSAYRKGWEQLVIMLITLLATLYKGLLFGIIMGMISTFVLHWFQSGLHLKEFWRWNWRPNFLIQENDERQEYYIRTKGVLNFLNLLHLKKMLRQAPENSHLILDLTRSHVIDHTVLEYLHEDAPKYDIVARQFDLVGLGVHQSSSRHPNSLHVLRRPRPAKRTQRQRQLLALSEKLGTQFLPELSWDVRLYKRFPFFGSRTIEYKINVIKGRYRQVRWESCDLIFDEGAIFSIHEYHTSPIVLRLPIQIPAFVVEKGGWLDKLGRRLSLKGEIDFKAFPNFSSHFLVHGENEGAIKEFFTLELIRFLENHPPYHLESTGNYLVVFKDMRFASPQELEGLYYFVQGFLDLFLTEKALSNPQH